MDAGSPPRPSTLAPQRLELSSRADPLAAPAQGHKLEVVTAGLMFLWSLILFVLVPINIEAQDSEAADACFNASRADLPNTITVPGEIDPSVDCAAAFAAAEPWKLDDDDKDEENAVKLLYLMKHTHLEACPAGCTFSARYTHEEATRFWNVPLTLIFVTVPGLVAGLLEDPLPMKGASMVYWLIMAISVVWCFIYLVGILGIDTLCARHGHDNLTEEQRAHYGEEHFCVQFTGTNGTFVQIIVVLNILTSCAGFYGGVKSACCKPEALYDEQKDDGGGDDEDESDEEKAGE